MQNLILTSIINKHEHFSTAGSGDIFPRSMAGDILIWVKESDLYRQTSHENDLPDSDLTLGFRV